jgi:hypothetical protein
MRAFAHSIVSASTNNTSGHQRIKRLDDNIWQHHYHHVLPFHTSTVEVYDTTFNTSSIQLDIPFNSTISCTIVCDHA